MKAIAVFILVLSLSSAVIEFADARSSLVRRKKKNIFDKAKNVVNKATDAVGKGVQAVGKGIEKGIDVVEKGVMGLVDVTKKILDKIKEFATEAKNKLTSWFNKILGEVEKKFKEFANKHKDDFGVSFIFTVTGQFRFEPKSPIAKKMLMKDLKIVDAVIVSLALNWDAEVEKTAIDFANSHGVHLFAYLVLDIAGKAPAHHKFANLCWPNLFAFSFNVQTKKPTMIGEGDFTKLPSKDCLKKIFFGELAMIPGLKQILAIPGVKKILGI